MESIVEVVRLLAGLSMEQLTMMLAFAALGVAALAISNAKKNKDL